MIASINTILSDWRWVFIVFLPLFRFAATTDDRLRGAVGSRNVRGRRLPTASRRKLTPRSLPGVLENDLAEDQRIGGRSGGQPLQRLGECRLSWPRI